MNKKWIELGIYAVAAGALGGLLLYIHTKNVAAANAPNETLNPDASVTDIGAITQSLQLEDYLDTAGGIGNDPNDYLPMNDYNDTTFIDEDLLGTSLDPSTVSAPSSNNDAGASAPVTTNGETITTVPSTTVTAEQENVNGMTETVDHATTTETSTTTPQTNQTTPNVGVSQVSAA